MIRRTRPDDAAGIVELVVAAEMFSPDESDVVKGLLNPFSAGTDEGHACLVDEHNGLLVGVAHYQPKAPADRVWDHTMIAVAPDLQAVDEAAPCSARWRTTCGTAVSVSYGPHVGHSAVRPDARLLHEVRLCGRGTCA